VYGPGEVRSPGIAQVLKKIESTIYEKEVIIEEVGAEERHHFTFVKDAAKELLKLYLRRKTPIEFSILLGKKIVMSLLLILQDHQKTFPLSRKGDFQRKD